MSIENKVPCNFTTMLDGPAKSQSRRIGHGSNSAKPRRPVPTTKLQKIQRELTHLKSDTCARSRILRPQVFEPRTKVASTLRRPPWSLCSRQAAKCVCHRWRRRFHIGCVDLNAHRPLQHVHGKNQTA